MKVPRSSTQWLHIYIFLYSDFCAVDEARDDMQSLSRQITKFDHFSCCITSSSVSFAVLVLYKRDSVSNIGCDGLREELIPFHSVNKATEDSNRNIHTNHYS